MQYNPEVASPTSGLDHFAAPGTGDCCSYPAGVAAVGRL